MVCISKGIDAVLHSQGSHFHPHILVLLIELSLKTDTRKDMAHRELNIIVTRGVIHRHTGHQILLVGLCTGHGNGRRRCSSHTACGNHRQLPHFTLWLYINSGMMLFSAEAQLSAPVVYALTRNLDSFNPAISNIAAREASPCADETEPILNPPHRTHAPGCPNRSPSYRRTKPPLVAKPLPQRNKTCS